MLIARAISAAGAALLALAVPACQPPPDQGEVAASFALEQVGDAYRWGGNGPDQWDCSGLVHRAWSVAGVTIARTSATLARQGTPVSRAALRPGDLVHSPGHVAIVVADGTQVAASGVRAGVVRQRIPAAGVTFTRVRR